MTRRSGFVLVATLLLTLMLSLVSLGALTTAAREVRIASTHQRRAASILRVEDAVIAVLDRWSTHDYAVLEVGAATTVAAGDPGTAVEVTRVDSSLYLLQARPVVGAGGALPFATRRAVLVRAFDPSRLAAAFPAAVATADAQVSGGRISGHDPCGESRPALWAATLDVGAGAVLSGFPTSVTAASPPLSAPNPFDPRLAARLAELPASEGFTFATESRTLVGTSLDGVLVVDGDLQLIDTGIRGLVVVSGTLTIDGTSRITGAVRTDRFRMRDGWIQRDGCAMEEALAASALDHPFRPEGRWWVPVF